MYLRNLLEHLLKSFISYNDKISLFSNFSEIEKFLKFQSTRKYEYFYLNRIKIHEILYESENIIKIQSNAAERNLTNLFYLDLLIKSNRNLTNYIYDIEYIENVNNFRKNSDNNLTNFILSMIIIELINNYRNADDYYDNKYEEKIEQIYKENEAIRNNYSLNEFNLNLIKEKQSNDIEEIYSQIIISLITKEKFKDYELINKTFNQLDFQGINITKNIFEHLLIIFNSNETFIKNYNISNINDLYDEQKINFYFLLFKYIFKNSTYIYHIPFLFKIRKSILRIIKKEGGKFSTIQKDKKTIKQMEYILKYFCDSKYYLIKYLGETYEKINQVLLYYQQFLFISKLNEINILKEYINDFKLDIDTEKYLKDFEKAKQLNTKYNIIQFLIEEMDKDIHKEENINECVLLWEFLETNIKVKKLKKIKKNYKQLLKKCFNQEKNKDLLLKIFTKDCYEFCINYVNKNKENIKKEIFINNNENRKSKLVEEISSINNEEKKSTDEDENGSNKSQKIREKKNNSASSIIYNSEEQIEQICFLNFDDSALSYLKIIGNHKTCAETVKESNYGYFYSYGERNIILYDSNYKVLEDIRDMKKISNIYEINSSLNSEFLRKKIKLVNCSNGNIYLMTICTQELLSKLDKYKIPDVSACACIEMNTNNFLIFGDKGVYEINDLFSKIKTPRFNTIVNKRYKGAVKITKNIIAISSNKYCKNGENKLIVYNSQTKKIIREIEGYSFACSKNGLAIMPKNEEDKMKNKILLCACKKYVPSEKNGILLINAEMGSNSEINEPFFDTGNFEVHCFCPLSLMKDTNTLLKEEITLIETDYLLVGGFSPNKGKGEIKLFKLIRNEDNKNINDTKIEYIQDIEVEKNNGFKGFNGAISSIIQSKQDGKTLVSCWDGNVYLLSYFNIELFLKFDEINKKNCMHLEEQNEEKEILIEA